MKKKVSIEISNEEIKRKETENGMYENTIHNK